MNLSFPKNGRVVVIDDLIAEGLPLINALSKNGIPTTYFTGKLDELPSAPLEDVRIVFLDIVLETGGQVEKNKVSTVIGVLKRIVSVGNGPYILIIWSKHEDLVESIKRELTWNPPLITLNLEKSAFMPGGNGDNLKKIEKKIKTEFEKARIFQLFLLWENIAHQSSGRLITEFKSLHAFDEDWDKNLTNVFYHLAKAYIGKTPNKKIKMEIIKNGFLALNGTYIDTFENSIKGYDYSKLKIQFNENDSVPEDICAKINKKLLLSNFSSNQSIQIIQPGNVYRKEKKDGNSPNIKELINGNINRAEKKKIKCILLEVSPLCDFAQDKWKLCRLLFGFKCPSEIEGKIKKHSDYIYISPKFNSNGMNYNLVFDFRFFIAKAFKEITGRKPEFRIRQELLVDIQSHLARHINRPGVISITYEKKSGHS